MKKFWSFETFFFNTRLMLVLLLGLPLIGCNSNNSPSSQNNPPVTTTPQQQVAANFSEVKDDQSWLHNPAWKDASGVEWSELMGNLQANVTLFNLEIGCNGNGGTLPTASPTRSTRKISRAW